MRTFALVYRVARPKWSVGVNRVGGRSVGIYAVAYRWCLSVGRRHP